MDAITRQFDLVHIHAGNLLEKAYQKQTSAGIQARSYIDKGQLVPDYIITAMVMQQLKEPEVIEKGYILDGFPRTNQQA